MKAEEPQTVEIKAEDIEIITDDFEPAQVSQMTFNEAMIASRLKYSPDERDRISRGLLEIFKTRTTTQALVPMRPKAEQAVTGKVMLLAQNAESLGGAQLYNPDRISEQLSVDADRRASDYLAASVLNRIDNAVNNANLETSMDETTGNLDDFVLNIWEQEERINDAVESAASRAKAITEIPTSELAPDINQSETSRGRSSFDVE